MPLSRAASALVVSLLLCAALLLVAALLLGATEASAEPHVAGSGLSFPNALPDYGQTLELVGRLDLSASEVPFPHDDTTNEYTWTLNGPVVHEVWDPAPGIRYRELTFGVMEIREDPARNSAFLANPPNISVPSTFHDGEILLMATVTNLELRDVFGIVTARADLHFEGGTRLDAMEDKDWTFNAAISTHGADIPDGYGSSWTLDLVPQVAVSVEGRSWGGIKALYR